jgi:hypothetical protein
MAQRGRYLRAVTIPLYIIGWRGAPDEPAELRPQFDNPVPCRVFSSRPLRHVEARLRWEGRELLVEVDVACARGEAPRAFCLTRIEYEPRSGLRRRRIDSIDVSVRAPSATAVGTGASDRAA